MKDRLKPSKQHLNWLKQIEPLNEFGATSTMASRVYGGAVPTWSSRMTRLAQLGLLSMTTSGQGGMNRYLLTDVGRDALRAAD